MMIPSFFMAVQTPSWNALMSVTEVVEPLTSDEPSERVKVGACKALLPTPDKPLNDGGGMMPLALPGSFSPSVKTIATRCNPWVVSGRGNVLSDETQPFPFDTLFDQSDDNIRQPHSKPVGMIVEPAACMLPIAVVNVVAFWVRNFTGAIEQGLPVPLTLPF